jgi:hypothetical protein
MITKRASPNKEAKEERRAKWRHWPKGCLQQYFGQVHRLLIIPIAI